ncbi:MAG: T9SS type A sorting domain-containing protein [Bacteroidota bacterium]
MTYVIAFNTNAQWSKTPLENIYVNAMIVMENSIFVGSSASGVFRSTDGGVEWHSVNTGLTCTEISSFITISSRPEEHKLFAGTANGLFLSTDAGLHWEEVINNLPRLPEDTAQNSPLNSLFTIGNVFLAQVQKSIFRSRDLGKTWVKILPDTIYHSCFIPNPSSIVDTSIFASFNGHVYSSSNFGDSWDYVGFTDVKALTMVPDNNSAYTIFLGRGWGPNDDMGHLFPPTFGDIYVSTNNGSSWEITTLDSECISSFASKNSNIFAGARAQYFGRIYLSTNNGLTWAEVGPVALPFVVVLTTYNEYLFAGTDYGLYKRKISEMITPVDRLSILTPIYNALSQNYPNPFNSTTVIRYQLPVAGKISLKIYDLLGREIATLVNEEQATGWKEVSWNGENASSGVFFYQITAGGKTETKKMILMK